MIDDAELLRRYAGEKSEEAFAEIVRRHLDFVYAAALRVGSGNRSLAEDVAQTVFADLARKAVPLARHEALVGWLHTATRYAAAKAVRAESRRQVREHEAHAMSETDERVSASADWARLTPVLDAVLGELKERERAAILLRFFERRSLAEVGTRLALSETAARSCVDRALEKLRVQLARRGVTSTAAAIGLALTSQPGVAAPAGLAASVTGAALAAGSLVGGGALVSVLTFMSTAKFGAVVAGVASMAVALAVYQTSEASLARTTLAKERAEFQRRWQAEVRRADAADADNAALVAAVAKLEGAKRAEPAITKQSVEARIRRAADLVGSGQSEEALAELLWCLDDGARRFAALETYRTYFLPRKIFELGHYYGYAPALVALRQRREAIEAEFQAQPASPELAVDVVGINGAMEEPERALAQIDKFPKGDQRRTRLEWEMRSELMAARRYSEVLEARPFRAMSTEFEILLQYNLAEPEGAKVEPGAGRDLFSIAHPTLDSAARDIEVLAGAGDVAHARELASRMLAFDDSEKTRQLIREHATRAGQPGLLESLPRERGPN